MQPPFITALVGFGNVSQGYANDKLMSKYYAYATHGQVLSDHPLFDWQVVIDRDINACDKAHIQWGVPFVGQSKDQVREALESVSVAIIATPPKFRLEILDWFPNLQAVLVEKPLGIDSNFASQFVDVCNAKGLLLQVNLWRRADIGFRSLANGRLESLIGSPQFATVFYGNGLMNNGIHMIDFVRMLFGDIKSIQRVPAIKPFLEGPISGDFNIGFVLQSELGIPISFIPLSFRAYRENGITIWGSTGRLDILNEGLTQFYFPVEENRAMKGESELVFDNPVQLKSHVGNAFYRMYTNLGEAMLGKEDLWSSGESAIKSAFIIDKIISASPMGELCAIKTTDLA